MRVAPRVRKWLTDREADPSVKWRYLVEVEGRPPGSDEVRAVAGRIGQSGWAASILRHQLRDGQWVTRGTSAGELYRPKFTATNWMAIMLGDFGCTNADPRIRRLAKLIFDRWGGTRGWLSGRGAEICVTGNATRTLLQFGYLDHPVVRRSIEWILRAQKSDGGWHCFRSRTGTLDSWEGLAALAAVPERLRDARVHRAIERGAEFFLRRQLRREGPVRYAPWFRIHYPNHYYYDLLVGLRILTRLGYGADRRLLPALRWLRSKQAKNGTWSLDAANPDLDPRLAGYGYREIVYPVVLEPLGEPSRWATVEALSVLTRASVAA